MALTVIVHGENPGSGDARRAASRSLTFDGARIVIGRGPSADVRLPDASVSHRHAVIEQTEGGFSLTDALSTNGTIVGDVRLEPGGTRTLRMGDRIRVGRVHLEVRQARGAQTPDLSLATRDLALALVADALEQAGDDPRPRLVVVEGPDAGAEFVLADEGRVYRIGRGAEVDFALVDEDVSREHAQIVRRAQTVLVRDLGTTNGSRLGEHALAQNRDTAWRSKLSLKLGKTVIALDEPAARVLEELEGVDDEPGGRGAEGTGEVPARADSSESTDPRTDSVAPNPRPAPSQPARSSLDLTIVALSLVLIGGSALGFYLLFHGSP